VSSLGRPGRPDGEGQGLEEFTRATIIEMAK
jgi:hypothetical protein